MINEARNSVGEIPSPKIAKVIVRATELNNKNIYLLQIGQACVTNWDSFVFLQIRANVVTNWGSYYKLGQPLL